MSKKDKRTINERAKSSKGLMKVLMALKHEGYNFYVRQFGKEIFTWDVVYRGELYSSYIVIKLKKKSSKLSDTDLNEVIKMCYAGAVTTIDTLLGKKLDKKSKKNVKLFESMRDHVAKMPE